MPVYRVDLLTPEPDPVLAWVENNVPKAQVVRTVAFKTVKGWYFKCVFRRQTHAEACHRRWHLEADSHEVEAFGQ